MELLQKAERIIFLVDCTLFKRIEHWVFFIFVYSVHIYVRACKGSKSMPEYLPCSLFIEAGSLIEPAAHRFILIWTAGSLPWLSLSLFPE